tara:strand:+ start:4521 stop:5432 length:912 start_codon:yes stop_codon:yes gene_type:complete
MTTHNNIDALNVNVLNVAKDEYTKQLNRILTPVILQGISSIYDDAINVLSEDEKNSGNDTVTLVQFQRLLKDVPKWNQNIINNECGRIKNLCPWLNDLIVAVFVTHVKILTSVKINKGNKQFKFSMPNFDTFIHNVYIEAAKEFFFNPRLIYSYGSEIKPSSDTNKIIEKSIDEAIRNLLPVQDILNTYIANNDNESDDDVIEEDVEEEDDEEEEIEEEDEEEEIEEEEPEERQVSFDEKGKPLVSVSEPEPEPEISEGPDESESIPEFNPDSQETNNIDDGDSDDNDELSSDYKRVKPSLDE